MKRAERNSGHGNNPHVYAMRVEINSTAKNDLLEVAEAAVRPRHKKSTLLQYQSQTHKGVQSEISRRLEKALQDRVWSLADSVSLSKSLGFHNVGDGQSILGSKLPFQTFLPPSLAGERQPEFLQMMA